MRADRLLSAVMLLQAHGRLSGRALAERLEVSERTIHRDMESLSAAGIPVFALRGAMGGWQLDEDWRTRVPALDDAELRALLMAQPRVIGDARLAAAAERAIGKLLAALPVPMRARAAAIRQRLHIDTTGWRGFTENLAMLPRVQDAVWSGRKLRIEYRAPGDPAAGERIVDALGMVAKGSTWYLFAGTPRGYRTYRVSRIEAAEVLSEACARPAKFDLAAEWKETTRRFEDERPRYDATLLTTAGVAHKLTMWQMATVLKQGGRLTVHVRFNSYDEARFVVRGLGPEVEVLAPDGLRETIRADLKAALRRMRTGNRRRYTG